MRYVYWTHKNDEMFFIQKNRKFKKFSCFTLRRNVSEKVPQKRLDTETVMGICIFWRKKNVFWELSFNALFLNFLSILKLAKDSGYYYTYNDPFSGKKTDLRIDICMILTRNNKVRQTKTTKIYLLFQSEDFHPNPDN